MPHDQDAQDFKSGGVNDRGWQGVPEARRRIMRANRRRDTKPERLIRSLLHARGLRFRVDFPIQTTGTRAIRPDVVFPQALVALFIDGCFWHGCPEHGTVPATNPGYWVPKLAENKRRDARNTAALQSAGWMVLRAWAHEEPSAVVARVSSALDVAQATTDRGGPATSR